MKKSRLFWVMLSWLWVSAPSAHAGPQTYGLWQYQAPSGDLQQGKVALTWKVVQERSFCVYSLYLAVVGGGDDHGNFAADWMEFAKVRGISDQAPRPNGHPAPNGWTRLEARREETSSLSGRYDVRQVTFSGHRRRMSALVVSNDARLCDADTQAFLASLTPLRPADAENATTAIAPPAQAPDQRNGAPDLTAQTWYKTAASYSHWGSNFSTTELSKLFGGQGYARRTWSFRPDGHYRFRVEIWSMTYKPKELSGIEEVGRWRRDGDRLTVEPQRAVTYVEARDNHVRLSEKPAKTATTVYRWFNHYLSGMGAWYLVLAPINGQPTDREGDFDKHPSFPGAYIYGPPPKVGG